MFNAMLDGTEFAPAGSERGGHELNGIVVEQPCSGIGAAAEQCEESTLVFVHFYHSCMLDD
jgi:hypothetical protein